MDIITEIVWNINMAHRARVREEDARRSPGDLSFAADPAYWHGRRLARLEEAAWWASRL